MQEEKRGFFGVIVPIEILDDPNLTPGEKLIYSYVASYSKACFDSNERIAERLGVGERSVSRALQVLSELGYVYVELVGNNNSARRIYAVFENPKKLAYLASKGMFSRNAQSYPQSRQNGETSEDSRQIGVDSRQIGDTRNGGDSRQIGDQRIRINKNKDDTEQKPNGSAGSACVAASRPKRKDFESDEEFDRAFYDWNYTVGAVA